MTPDEVAQKVLDEHHIRDDWRRTGEQIRGLLAEAVELYRTESGIQPKPLPEGYILGLREHAASINFAGGEATLDHGFGAGTLALSLTVEMDDGARYIQTVNLSDYVKSWVEDIVTQHERNSTDGD